MTIIVIFLQKILNLLTIRIFLKILPWVIAAALTIILVAFYYSSGPLFTSQPQTIVTQNTVLREVESLGKLELVRYNFKDITELEKRNDGFVYKLFRMDNAKIALISVGSATGCIDLTKIKVDQIRVFNDSLFIRLPEPELCYYKLDMDKTRIYSLDTEWQVDEKEFIQEGYKLAEQRIKESALTSGILDQTTQNAELILRPLLEKVAAMPVVFTRSPTGVKLKPTF